MWRTHAVGLQMDPEGSEGMHSMRELFFFNTFAMDAGYGSVPSRVVTAQLSFAPRQIADFAVGGLPGMAAGGRSKAHLVLRYVGERGVEVSDLTLKQPKWPKQFESVSRWAALGLVAIVIIAAGIGWKFYQRKSAASTKNEEA